MIAEETLTILSQLTGKSVHGTEARGLFQHLNHENAFAPPAMVTTLIEALQLQYNATARHAVNEPIFSDILARDRFSGYYIHGALRTLYIDFAITRSGLPGQQGKNFLILGDFFNLSSVNDAIGRSATNDVMATICGIYLDCMTRAGVVDWLYHRSMGDEVTFVILNTDEKRVQDGLKEAEKITEEFIVALGIERLRHKKYPGCNGSGLMTATMILKPDTNHRLLKQQLDEAISTRKKGKTVKSWLPIGTRGIEPEQFHNRASEQKVDKALHKYRQYRNSAQFTSDAETKTMARSALNPAKSLLVGRAIAWPRDDRIEYLTHHHNNSKIMLRADVYNLGGLNAVFGHDGADQIKAHLIRIIYSTITAHDMSEPKIFDCGGGIIDAVINDMPNAQLHRLIQALQNNIYYQILSHSVAGYADAYNLSYAGDGTMILADLPHPRGENKGTGLIMATHAVELSRSLPEIIERLDKITHRTKMHDFAYLWTDEAHRVYGLRLNHIPDPILIGAERADGGAHYLPYTDALRQHLKQEDLPGIFERPVGQICEILFGTDMQAVLGFKKAIRLLQENNVSDNDIEKIASYAEMDGQLKAHNLPPLSVVSTQNRPAFVNNEREAFKTITLAEKLEDLPRSLTGLILQGQAIFRTMKLVQPHGRLATAQAAQVLLEEVATPVPDVVKDHPSALQLTESLYLLARLFDRCFAALNRDLPDDLRKSLNEFSLETLKELSNAFDNADETLLAKRLQAYVRDQQGEHSTDRTDCLQAFANAVAPLLEKLDKKQIINAESRAQLQQRFQTLIQIATDQLGSVRLATAAAS